MIETKNSLIKERLKSAFLDPVVKGLCLNDFIIFFEQLGLPKAKALPLIDQLIQKMMVDNTLEETEKEVRAILNNVNIAGKPFFDSLKSALQNRDEIIIGQIEPYLRGIKGKIIDFGAGSGLIAQILHDRCDFETEAVEVRDWKSKAVTIPFLIFDGRKVPVPDKYYEAAIMTNVAHHEENNEAILVELTRIARRRLIVIETVPEDSSKEQLERTFTTDALWNRFFFYADIPVPGTYELPEGWITRFEKYGWNLFHSGNLGYDIPAVQVMHHLFVFEAGF